MGEIMGIFFWIALGSAWVYWGIGFTLLYKIHVLKAPEKPLNSFPSLSIIIPARNEEERIVPLLDSLAEQDYPQLEILIVDDQSTDRTAELCRQRNLSVLEIEEKPEKWNGKSHAMHKGVEHTKGDMLLFLDADVILGRNSLQTLLSNYQEGIVSVQPFHLTRKLYESFSLFPNLLVASSAFSLGARTSRPVIFGPVVLLSRNDYESLGGYASIAEEAVDDMALAGRASSLGMKIQSFQSTGDFSFRMYPLGIRDLVQGWSKNLAIGGRKIALKAILLQIIWITGMINACLTLPYLFTISSAILYSLVMGIYLLYGLQLYFLTRPIGKFYRLLILLYPINFVFFILVLLRSFIYTDYKNMVMWKGRELKVKKGEAFGGYSGSKRDF